MKNPVDGLPQSATAGALRTVELRVETKFLRLGHPVPLGSYFGDWRVLLARRLGQAPGVVCGDGLSRDYQSRSAQNQYFLGTSFCHLDTSQSGSVVNVTIGCSTRTASTRLGCMTMVEILIVV